MPGQSSFSAQVSAWVAATQQRSTAVFRESAERVIEQMQTPVAAGGNMPVDTGFLRASLQASTSQPQPINPGAAPAEGSTHTYSAGVASLVITGAELGQTVFATYTAAYAAEQEYGARGREGRGFVRLAAQQWPQIVSRVSAELQSRSESTPGT